MRWVNMNKSFKDLIDMFNVGASEKGIKLEYECDIDFPDEVYIDE